MRPTSRSAGTLFLVVADDDFTVFKCGKGFLGGEGLGTRYGQSSEGGWFFEHDWQGPPRYVQVRGWFFGEELVRYCFLLSLSKISRSRISVRIGVRSPGLRDLRRPVVLPNAIPPRVR
jgi:hypothetical protein